MAIISCSGKRPGDLGIKASRLAPCPPSPNCVSSDDAEAAHAIVALQLALAPAQAWPAVQSAVADFPRTEIVAETDDYLHAECSSTVFGFVDDLELHLRPAQNVIAVRSAARLGKSDFGVNRRRVETLRELLRRQGVIR